MNRATEPDDFPGFQFKEHGKSDDEEHDTTEDATDTPTGRGKKVPAWHRMKWTDSMVKLLITAVSYTGDDHGVLGGGRRKFAIIQKKGKWKAISKVMVDRHCNVSPQQCEDKFNDLNKRYKRLIDILGQGTACKVVTNTTLLDSMSHISDKMKDDVRKILNSKHLFFEEMCSYHNNNRENLHEDHALQQSLLLALRSKEEHGPQRDASGGADQDDQSADSDYEQNYEEQLPMHTNMSESSMHKRARHSDMPLVTSNSHEGSERFDPHGITVDINNAFPNGTNLASQVLEVQKRLLQIEERNLELTEQRLKWEQFRKKKDREIETMALKNKHKMVDTKRLELELRQKELELKLKGHENRA
ncbi:hypothetical protein HU200_067652 [Digitaria exilis]|uniref:Myb/SANT-like DNA-binding domain-containing protein n=1 Tax=Digitaria exilis TaxID=1010633 RepID=A0A834ZUU3_9POAL|nr:hypothetical protein HU200_067652 [Digitaria exilis]